VLAINIALIVVIPGGVSGGGGDWIYIVTLALQLALLAGALLAPRVRSRPLLIAQYYVVTNWALAAGLWDWLRGDRSPIWETVEGTR
jgi:hypothetical protein